MRCERIKEWMDDRLDGCLDADRTREMDAHLAGCEACRREWAEIRQTVSLLHDLPLIEPPADLLPSVRRRLAQPRQATWVVCWRVLSLPQTRVAVAASLVAALGIYGWRAMSAGQARMPDLPTAPSRPVVPGRPTHAQGLGDAPVASVSQIQILDVRRELAADKSPVDKLTPTEPLFSKDSETKGRIWKKQDATEATDRKEKVAVGLSVGPATSLVGADDGHAGRPTVARNEPAIRASMPMPETASAPTAAAAPPKTSQPVAQTVDEGLAYRMATTKSIGGRDPAPTTSVAWRQGTDRNREIVLAANDIEAVRKVLAQYAVPWENLEAGNTKAKESLRRMRSTEENGNGIAAWVPAAYYAQLLAGLRSAGTVKLRPDAGGAKDASGMQDADTIRETPAGNAATNLLFVRITVVPVEK